MNLIYDNKHYTKIEGEFIMAENFYNHKIRDGISIWQSIKILIIILIFQVVAGLVVGIIESIIQGVFYLIRGTNLNISFGYVIIIAEIIGYLSAYRLLQKKNKFDFKIKNKISFKEALICLAILVGYILIADNSINLIIEKLITDSWVNNAFSDISKTPLAAFILVVFVAPFFEELFMRGIVLEQLLRRYKPVIAITISALLFAILHMNVTQGVNAFLLGIIFGLVYTRTKNLSLCFLMHGTNNLFSTLAGYFPAIYSTNFSAVKLILGILILVVSLYNFNLTYENSSIHRGQPS